MFGYLEQTVTTKVISGVGYVLVKYYDFDLQDMDRFLSLYSKEMKTEVRIEESMRTEFEEWSKVIRNTPSL